MLNALKYPPSVHPLCVEAQPLKLQLITCDYMSPAILANYKVSALSIWRPFHSKANQMHCLQS